MPVSSPASSPHCRQPTSAFPPFSEPDPDSESRPLSPYGKRDPRQPQNNLYSGAMNGTSSEESSIETGGHSPILFISCSLCRSISSRLSAITCTSRSRSNSTVSWHQHNITVVETSTVVVVVVVVTEERHFIVMVMWWCWVWKL